jgi:hypothetical protein
MSSRSKDSLIQLIHSLQRGEKRNFKSYVQRNTSNQDLKIVQLFDALDKMKEYDETALLKKIHPIKKDQLPNRKAHLYKQILASLRLLETNENIDIQLREQMDYARILYNKGLYVQSLKILEKAKESAQFANQYSFLVQILFMEKKIESLHITRSLHDRAKFLTDEADDVIDKISLISRYSNLALELYGWYIHNGHARNEADEDTLADFFKKRLPAQPELVTDFYQKLYLFQSYCWYAFILQDFLLYYRYAQKWADLFHKEPFMIEYETMYYIKAMHNLLNAHFDLKNYKKFDETLEQFQTFAASEIVARNENNSAQVFVYMNIARLNRHFMHGTFTKGLELVPVIIKGLGEYAVNLDQHRVLVFYYKIASLYFGSGDYGNTITYLNKIINWKVDLRNDLQCYARLLSLIAHYELGNFDLLQYLVKSVYRFMAKMENLGAVEEEVFRFLQRSFMLSPNKLKPEFEKLLASLKGYENSRSESRAFSYLDIISWLESKISNQHVQDVVREKYKVNKRSRH